MPDATPGMVQISQAELDQLRGTRELLGRMLGDPKRGLDYKRHVKEIIPDAKFPELDYIDTAAKPVLDRLEAVSKDFQAFKDQTEKDKKDAADRAAEQSLRDRLGSAQRQYGFTDEGMELVVKRMREQQSADVEGAAAYIYGLQPKPKATNPSGLFPSKMDLFGSANLSDDPKIQLLHKDPMAFMEQEAIAILNEAAEADAA